jgi:hypothetical protein
VSRAGVISANDVILVFSLLMILVGGWNLVFGDGEPVGSIIPLGLGVILSAGVLTRIRKGQIKSHRDSSTKKGSDS